MFARISLLTALGAAVVAFGAGAGPVSLRPSQADRIAGCGVEKNTYEIGGIFGHWLLAGHANQLERNDRSVIRFDLARQIVRGGVDRAVLRTRQSHFGYRDETVRLEVLTAEWPQLTANTLLTNQTRTIAEYTVSAGTADTELCFDVTDFVNAGLLRGNGSLLFRFSSLTAAREGNPQTEACGVTIHENDIELSID